MVSPTVNVVRYTALFSGVLYGVLHRRSLQKKHDLDKEHHALSQRETLITEAKEVWKKKQEKGNVGGIITDPEDPQFDLEKLVAKLEADSK